jgi:hypothetical protein
MGITKAAETTALSVAAKMPSRTALLNQTVIEGLPVAAGLPELDVVSDLFGNGCWILA